MKLAVISFTRRGSRLCGRLVQGFRDQGEECDGYVKEIFFNEVEGRPGLHVLRKSVGEWTAERFSRMDGLIYIGAVGIAVRAIAPYLKDKMTDPAIVAVDEAGNYVISLLSGHVGGANKLTRAAAQIIGAAPVITTATDVNGITAIDQWAKERGLQIEGREPAKRVAAALLEGKPVGVVSDFPLSETLPEGYFWEKPGEQNAWITVREKPEKGSLASRFFVEEGHVLRLIPRILTVGIGCRRGVSDQQIEKQIERTFEEANLDKRAVAAIATIDLKRQEAGLCRLAEKWGVPLAFFSAEELEKVKESVSESSFVRQVTGTGNVCERAALLCAGSASHLLVKKRAENGVTVAVAEADYQVGMPVRINGSEPSCAGSGRIWHS